MKVQHEIKATGDVMETLCGRVIAVNGAGAPCKACARVQSSKDAWSGKAQTVTIATSTTEESIAMLELFDRARSLGYDEHAAAQVADVFTTVHPYDPCPIHPAMSCTQDRHGYAAEGCESCQVVRLSDEARTYAGRTANEWEALAAESTRSREASFERCDTDGFLSQAASQAMAREYALCAQVARKAGTWEFPAVFDNRGTLVAVHAREGQFGQYYVNVGLGGNTAPRTITPSRATSGSKRHANDSARGFRMGTVSARAQVRMSASWHPYVSIDPTVTLSDCKVVDNGTALTCYQDK